MKDMKSMNDDVSPIADQDHGSNDLKSQKEPELRRQFSTFSMINMCLCLMATWEAVSSVMGAALISGGSVGLLYGYILTYLCSIAMAASLGEIASIYPSSAGQYSWAFSVSPVYCRRVISWYTGWISLAGLWALSASAAMAAALQWNGLILLSHPSINLQRYQAYLMYLAVILVSTIVNVFTVTLLPWINHCGAAFHVLAFFIISLILLVMAPKHNAGYVFANFENNSGWSSDGLSWMLGLISSTYTILGYDGAAHLTDEMFEPKKGVPKAMYWSVIFNGAVGLVFVIIVLFCLGDLTALIESPTGFPVIQLFYNTTSSQVATCFMCGMITVVAVLSNIACTQSCSRTTLMFARDGGLPFSSYFSQIDQKRQVPTRTIVLSSMIQAVLGVIYIGNTTAFNAILQIAVVGLYLSYLLPTIMFCFHGRRKMTYTPGPFNLGRWGLPINLIAIAFTALCSILLLIPSYMPLTAANMNYSSAVLGLVLIIATVTWFTRGRKEFIGSLETIQGVLHQSSA